MATYTYQCDRCSRSFDTQGKLNRHLNIHKKPFRCQTCEQGFALRLDLNRHIRARHRLGLQKYACGIQSCTYKATRKDNLRQHVQRIHGQCVQPITVDEVRKAQSPGLSHAGDITLLSSPTVTIDESQFLSRELFLQAASTGNLVILQAGLNAGIDVNILAEDNSTPLHCAARAAQTTAVRYLIENGAQIESINKKSRSALHEAILSRNLETVDVLLQNGAIRDSSGMTVACLGQSGSVDIMKLYASQPEFEMTYSMAYDLLCAASRTGQLSMVAALLSRPQDKTVGVRDNDEVQEYCDWGNNPRWIIPNKRGFMPLHLAAARGHLEIVQLLIVERFRVDLELAGGIQPLHLAAREGHFEVVEYLLSQKDVNVNCRTTYSHCTPLYFAVKSGRVEVVRLLIRHEKVNINAQDLVWIETPLHAATKFGHLEIAKLLMSHAGVDMNAQSSSKETPLHNAAGSGHLEIAKLLISYAGVNINAQCLYKTTPLHKAAGSGHLEIAKLLISYAGVNINAQSSSKETPLHLAVKSGKLEVVELLLDQECIDFRCSDNKDHTPLQLSAFSSHWNVAQLLLDHEGNQKSPIQVLQQAPSCSHEVVKKLLNHPDFRDVNMTRYGEGLLHKAVRNNDCGVIQLLLGTHDIDVNQPEFWRGTPLHLATEFGRTDAVRLLLQHEKINVNWSRYGETALKRARELGFDEIVDLLLAHGAIDYDNDKALSGASQNDTTGSGMLNPLVRESGEPKIQDSLHFSEGRYLDNALESNMGEMDEMDLLMECAVESWGQSSSN